MTAETEADLTDLQCHWGTAYEISFDEVAGTWSARYQGCPDRLTGDTSDELRQAIRANCRERRLADQQSLAGLQERSST
jgi:hypothetical protein